MSRPFLALIALFGFVAPAPAQPGRLPLAPGVRPASPIGPGTQFLPLTPSRFAPALSGSVGRARPFTPQGPRTFGLGYGYPFYGYGYYGGPSYDYGYAPPIVIETAPLSPPLPPERTVALANEFPATLTVQFPAPATVWLNGAAVTGEPAEERVLTSPVLKPGEQFAFEVRGRWTAGGKTYEAARTVTLGSGDRSRLLLISGTEVK